MHEEGGFDCRFPRGSTVLVFALTQSCASTLIALTEPEREAFRSTAICLSAASPWQS